MQKKKVRNHWEYFPRSGYQGHDPDGILSFQTPTLLPWDSWSRTPLYEAPDRQGWSLPPQAFQSLQNKTVRSSPLFYVPDHRFPVSVHREIHVHRYSLYAPRSG